MSAAAAQFEPVTAAPLLYDPSEVQKEFHALTVNEALFGGAAGPGKSLCLLMDVVEQIVVEHERYARGEIKESTGWALHLRREFTRLEQTIARAHRYFKALDPGVLYDRQSHTFRFQSGYKVQFGHMAGKTDYLNYSSNEYTHIAFDELTEFSEEQFRYMATRLRSTDPVLSKMLRVRAATNPVGEGVMWVRPYFVDPAPQGRKVLRRKVWLEDSKMWATRSRIYIPAKLSDNPIKAFREQYEAELRDKPAHIRDALLNANWYVVANAFYAEEIVPEVHFRNFKAIFPKGLPSGWTRGRGMDWGYKTWCVIYYFAVDPDDRIWIYREISIRKKRADAVADHLIEVEQSGQFGMKGCWDFVHEKSKVRGPADNQIREQRGSIGETIDETFRKKGIFWDMATKNRAASVEQFRARLLERGGENQDLPGILFDESCVHARRTIPSIPTDESDPELPKDGGDDHWLDTVHYICMSRPRVPDSDEAPKRDYDDEMAEFREKKKRGQPRVVYLGDTGDDQPWLMKMCSGARILTRASRSPRPRAAHKKKHPSAADPPPRAKSAQPPDPGLFYGPPNPQAPPMTLQQEPGNLWAQPPAQPPMGPPAPAAQPGSNMDLLAAILAGSRRR